MTVKEYLEINNTEYTCIESIGIFKANEKHDIIENNANSTNVVKYLDLVIDHVNLYIYDEKRKTIYGDDYDAKFIRACIYVR